ncbi:MAG: hypothetical protein B9S36_00980 [Verrucomicrobiia bacterium Tous-C2TDCM]|nr:MAG: hypothetical protein B9S36_00980 [Verrucomicrobiae bacterium Tous-C2TDCM]
MASNWRSAVLVVFLVGMVLIGMVGTSASMTFLWPGYGVLGLAAVLSVGLILEESPFSLPRAATFSLLALCGYLLVRASDSPVAYFAREDASLVVMAFLAYGLFVVLFRNIGSRHRLVEVLALLVGINLAFAFAQAVILPTLWILPGYERTFTNHPGGLFNHPDHFTGFLAVLVPVWLAVALYSRRGRPVRTAATALALVSILTILVIGSGPSFLALAVGAGGFVLLSLFILHRRMDARSRSAGWRILAGTSIFLLGISVLWSAPLGRLIDRTLLTKSGGLSLPLVWKAGIAQITEAPLFGTGSRSSHFYGRLFREETLDSSATEPEFIHNEVLQMAADYGLVGLLLLLTLLALHARQGFGFVRAYAVLPPVSDRIVPKSDHLALVVGAMAALAALGVLSCFDFLLHLPVFALTGALFLAVLAVPDPLAAALKVPPPSRLFPGGWLVFSNRALVFGCGLAMTLFGAIFSRSEHHFEQARRSFSADRSGFQHHRHLKAARQLDPKNPFLFSLSAHAQVSGILPEMPEPARRDALEKADFYFNHSRNLYPQDIFAAIGHAAVLDELGRPSEALARLREARKMAPYYGNLLIAEGEHHFRHGRIVEAEKVFSAAISARAFRDTAAAQRGLRALAEWKLIAEQNGIDWRADPDPLEVPPLLAGSYESRLPAEAEVAERALAGRPPEREDPTGFFDPAEGAAAESGTPPETGPAPLSPP